MGHYATMELEVVVMPYFRELWQKLSALDEEQGSPQHVLVPAELDGNHPLFANRRWDVGSEPAFYQVGELLIAGIKMYVNDYHVPELVLNWMTPYLVLDETGKPIVMDPTGAYGTWTFEHGGFGETLYHVVWQGGELKVDREHNLIVDDRGDWFHQEIPETPAQWDSRFIDCGEGGELKGRGMLTVEIDPIDEVMASVWESPEVAQEAAQVYRDITEQGYHPHQVRLVPQDTPFPTMFVERGSERMLRGDRSALHHLDACAFFDLESTSPLETYPVERTGKAMSSDPAVLMELGMRMGKSETVTEQMKAMILQMTGQTVDDDGNVIPAQSESYITGLSPMSSLEQVMQGLEELKSARFGPEAHGKTGSIPYPVVPFPASGMANSHAMMAMMLGSTLRHTSVYSPMEMSPLDVARRVEMGAGDYEKMRRFRDQYNLPRGRSVPELNDRKTRVSDKQKRRQANKRAGKARHR